MTNQELTATERTATVAAQDAPVAPRKAPSKKGASPKKDAPKGEEAAKAPQKKAAKASKKTAKTERAEVTAPRAESKGANILEMIGRAKGSTLAEIMKATDWQAHSVRGFISTAAKKHGVKVESAKNEAGDRAYRILK